MRDSSFAVCTLFEGDFHHGVGALVNSLHAAGYRGDVWVGHRGPLPPWAQPLQTQAGLPMFEAADDCRVHFVPVETTLHLTNYKAAFMRRVLNELAPGCGQVFYFDPDIVVRFPWDFFRDWASDSVALCEDVNSPVHDTHPKRNAWRRFFTPEGIVFRNALHTYLNGGFVAVPRSLSRFLVEWDHIMEVMNRRAIDLGKMGVNADFRFWFIDQDALNVAAMTTDCPLSLCGQEGMGFVAGNGPMLHAIGKRKPWHRDVLRNFLDGRPPTTVEREYWDHVERPIRLFDASVAARHRRLLAFASGAARFYRR